MRDSSLALASHKEHRFNSRVRTDGLLFLSMLLLGVMMAMPVVFAGTSTQTAVAFSQLPGSTATMLPNGRWLLTGGEGTGAVSNAIEVLDAVTLQPAAVSGGRLHLNIARTGHTATVLPDGTVFIFGGVSADGALVSEAEIVDTESGVSTLINTPGLTPRTQQTATLLTDGRVLIAGGLDANGTTVAAAQLWDPQTRTVDSWMPALQTPRYNHTAELLASGAGLLTGGKTDVSNGTPTPEVFNPGTNLFSRAPWAGHRAGDTVIAPAIAETIPANGATDVPVTSRIAIRFDEPLVIAQLNTASVTLVGASGAVSGKVVGAESGMLLFFTPSIELAPGATYTLFIDGVSDASGAVLPLSSTQFTTHYFSAAPASNVSTAATVRASSNNVISTSSASSASAALPSTAVSNASRTLQPAEATSQTAPPDASDTVEDWIPRDQNRHGPWKILGLPDDPSLAATALTTTDLQAAPGQTAISGHVLRMNGRPLSGVAVSAGQVATITDASGRFLLSPIGPGTQQLRVDGTVVTTNGWHYTKHYIQAQVHAGQTTVLPASVFLPRVDPSTEVTISSPAAKETVLTNRAIPGLEVHIPAGAVLREPDGALVTKVSITPLPVDRAPYPTPTNFSVYFTLQPGGAFVDGDPSKAVQIIYPNYLGLAPGARVDFWNYDPSSGGWAIYGHGVVTSNGRQIRPDKGVGFRQIMTFGFGVSSSMNPPTSAPPPGSCSTAGDPVNCATGFFTNTDTDMRIQDSVPISVTRTYMSNDPTSRAFGIGTNMSYSMYLYTADTTSPYQDIYLILPDGGRVHYALQSTSPSTWKNLDSPTVFYGSTMQYAQTPYDLITVTLADHTVLNFISDAPNQLSSIVDGNGNAVNITLSGGRSGNIKQVLSPNGRYIQFTYDSANRITSATDNLGRSVGYTYDASGRLYQVTDQAGHIETYGYDASNRMTTLTDKRQNTVFTNVYNSGNQVTRQTLADGSVWQFSYTTTNGSAVTTVTDPRNYRRQDTFNAAGYLTQEILAMGEPEQQTYTMQLNTANLISSVTDALGREVTYNAYNTAGEPTSITQLAGTTSAVTTSYSYDPVFQKLASYTDPLGHTSQWSYDASGNLSRFADALGHAWSFVSNGQGLPASVTDPLSHTVQFGYSGGDLSTLTDGLGRISTVFTDEVGRPISGADPLGDAYQYGYDLRDEVTSITDPIGGITSITYDANGNALTIQDPRNVGVHTFTYDALNRVNTYKDPLGNIESYNYDGMGNLTSKIDRKNQTTSFTYDGLNRLTTITYSDNSSLTVSWDAGNRATQFVDTTNGTITRQYDGFDRLQQEVSPQGQVNYTYDAANRRTQLTVNGLAAVTYQYDNANRLTQIAQGTTTVAISYDAANRRTGVTWPNGIAATATYDNANELLTLSYASGSTSIGSLAYTYDQAGRRSGQSGSFARLAYPTSVATASYNAANQLTNWGSIALTYDANGNLTTAGSSTYGWNARNQLIATSDGGGAFAYDPLGRRMNATVSGTTTPYLYDGLNVATAGGSQMLDGPGLDETYARVNSSGITSILSDALGSTLALTNSAAATTATYNYSPYGGSSSTGTDSTSFQFTGRENDGASNLYYYRARYYNPTIGRFISSDPMGLAGGVNPYAYANGNPISITDPLGLWGGFGFGSVTLETPGPVRVAGEGIGLGGYDSNTGWYAGDIFAHGMEYGGHENYYAHFKGKEVTTSSCGKYQGIDIKEGSIGAEIPFLGGVGIGAGKYQLADGEWGIFFFVGGGDVLNHGSLGVGFHF